MSWQCAPALCSGDFTYTDTDPFAGCLQLQHHGRACAPVRVCSIKPRWSRAGFQPIGPASHGVRACHDRLVCLGLPTCAASVEGHPADHPAEHSSGSSTHAAYPALVHCCQQHTRFLGHPHAQLLLHQTHRSIDLHLLYGPHQLLWAPL